MKKLLTLIGCFLLAVLIVFFMPSLRNGMNGIEINPEASQGVGLFHQKITGTAENPDKVFKLYHKGELVGILKDRKKLNALLKEVYEENYREEFPDSSVRLDKDIYTTEEQTGFTYSDADDEIIAWLKENDLFTIECTAVSFSENGAVYAEIYVKDPEMYEKAMNEYITYFIDPEALVTITGGKQTPQLTTYGTRDVGISISESISEKKAFAKPSEIKKTEEEILEYLKYGEKTKKEYYTVKEYDTVAGVGAKNYGLSATQVMNLNRDKITDVDQILKAGDKLCITYFESPVNIVVTKQALRKEPLYPDTIYVEDPELLKGTTELRQAGEDGYRNALYQEKWINGVLINGVLESSVDVKQPTNEIIALGTKELPNVGTGIFRFPVDNAIISCGWGCYYGHRGVDFQNLYNKWDYVHAADRGVISKVAYHYVNGNYVLINHNNGLSSYYGHMRELSPLPVGTVVDKGDIIGRIGMTGYATGPHVHFFIFDTGNMNSRYNPCAGFLPCY